MPLGDYFGALCAVDAGAVGVLLELVALKLLSAWSCGYYHRGLEQWVRLFYELSVPSGVMLEQCVRSMGFGAVSVAAVIVAAVGVAVVAVVGVGHRTVGAIGVGVFKLLSVLKLPSVFEQCVRSL